MTAAPRGGALPVPNATPLTCEDWADLMADIADEWERRLLADARLIGHTVTSADALRAFAAWTRAGMPDDDAPRREGAG